MHGKSLRDRPLEARLILLRAGLEFKQPEFTIETVEGCASEDRFQCLTDNIWRTPLWESGRHFCALDETVRE